MTRADATPSKADVLQSLLDTQALCLELFDAVDEDRLAIDVRLLGRLGGLVKALGELHRNMVLEYVASGRAGDDLIARVRADLQRGRS